MNMHITSYERLGGAGKARELAERFYNPLATLPKARDIRRLHPTELHGSREKPRLFLAGWLGGPRLRQQRYGYPRVRARRLPFPIGARERDPWLVRRRRGLDELDVAAPLRGQLRQAFSNKRLIRCATVPMIRMPTV